MTDTADSSYVPAPGAPEVIALRDEPALSPGQRALHRFLRHRLAMGALLVLLTIVAVTVLAPLFQRYPYEAMNLRAAKQGPTLDHWFGTDRIGRDIWSRTLNGARVSLAVGLATGLLSTLFGTLIGALSGYYGGWVDMILMRLTDVVMTFPSVVVMLTLATLLPRNLTNLVLIIAVLSWPAMARLVRGQFLSARENDYILAARCLGVQDYRIITLHILPNVFAPMLAQVTFTVGEAILIEAGLSFLGMGVPPPMPSWGNMLEAARNLEILQYLPWMWIPPAIAVVITVLCVNFIGDGLRDATDPRQIIK